MPGIRSITSDLDTELELRGFEITEDEVGSFTAIKDGLLNHKTMSVNVAIDSFGGFETTVQSTNEMGFLVMEWRVEYADETDLVDNVVEDATRIVDKNPVVNL